MIILRPHLLVQPDGKNYDFKSSITPQDDDKPPEVRNRFTNAQRVVASFEKAIARAGSIDAATLSPDQIPLTVLPTTEWGVNPSVPGRKREVLSFLGFGKHARVNMAFNPLAMKNVQNAAGKYSNWTGFDNRPMHFWFFEAAPFIDVTTAANLWTGGGPLPEGDEEFEWEVWLTTASEGRFREALEHVNARYRRSSQFERINVVSVRATPDDMNLLALSGSIAQLRPASSLTRTFMDLTSSIQQSTIDAASQRLTTADEEAPAVCILDTGLSSHALLNDSVSYKGSVPGANEDDWHGHGTQMAGLALFEDLAEFLNDAEPLELPVRIESISIEAQTHAQGISPIAADRIRKAVEDVEFASSASARTYCLAMNAPEDGADGAPSSLSCEIDKLCFDQIEPRLFCVAAGNVDVVDHGDYQSLNDINGMMSPSQAFNALSVAACTDRIDVALGRKPLAPAGDLSPFSRTSVNWDRRRRPPIKPDVVFEGGNLHVDKVSNKVGIHSDLFLLTTGNADEGPLTLTGMTSAATASVAGLCARVQAGYPDFWPETVRGLVAHSAEHTPAMLKRAAAAPQQKTFALLQRFGYGRVNPKAVLDNAKDTLTLVVQDRLHPLRLNQSGKGTILGQMKAYSLPWPTEILEGLGETEVELRVTLSYFIEPNPAEVVRGDSQKYISHGFDFDLKRADEDIDQAIARLNDLHEVDVPSSAGKVGWALGGYRGRGSLKHDRLTVRAEDLALMDSVLVIPRKGWWESDLERVIQSARFSLIVSIRTPEVDIYTKIATEISVLV
jgi:hypothetical protein